jgi:hypothetical protein
MADMLRRDETRANGILKRNLSKNGCASSSAAADVPTTLGLPLDTLEYVVTVRLGTPAVTQTLEIDTGSGLSWVQCRPCPARRCQPQKDPFFDPGKSSTYSPYTCGSSECAELRRARYGAGGGCSSHSLCRYIVKYGDGSNTTGTYGSDDLTLTSSSDVVRKFRFGCSHATQGTVGRVDGLLALGGGAQSLVSQIGGKAFSYCLPPTPERTGFLSLGAPPLVSASRYVVTPMHRSRQDPTFYFVLLRAISVAGRRLDMPPSVFAAGSVVDSGTIITRLPPTAYRALRAAFRKEMRAHGYPPAGPNSILDTCYNLTGVGDVKLPRVALVFERDATVELHPSGVMEQDCLAFAPTAEDGSPGIIGNVQQRTFEVLYDVGGGAVGFRRGVC